MQSAREQFLAHQKKLAHLTHIQALLARDQEALMPVKAGEWRAQQIGYMATLYHEAMIDTAYCELVEQLHTSLDHLGQRQQRSIRLAQKEIQQTQRVEVAFVEHFEMTKTRAQQVRYEARRTNNFQLFAPYLQEVINLTNQYAQAIAPDNQPYDTLLDIYEEWATQERYDSVLLPLQQPLTILLQTTKSKAHQANWSAWLTQQETKQLLRELCKTVGFDFDSGLLWEVHHPFMTTIGGYDYRINTRYDHPVEAITGMIHELGHGLYEQWNDPKFHYTNLHYGSSTWMHESQSRTLENMIGRSRGMSNYLDRLSKELGTTYTGSAEDWYAVCNHVHPSLIRIEADEISYGLHILLRYELEKELIWGKLSVADLPTARNHKMITYLGIEPKNDAEWCLQDVHRSCGLFGYFPTYLLGNLYAGQLRQVFSKQHATRETEVAEGNFSSYFNRYKENVRQYARSLHPQDLLKKITGASLDASYFLEYLNHKFS